MSDIRAGLRLALGTLTILPSGPIGAVTSPVARTAMMLAPVVVLPLSIAVAVVAWIGDAVRMPQLVTAVLAMAGLARGSRGMHLDGLVDTVDGFGAGWDRERALRVMRSGDVGPMGVVVVVVVVVVQMAAGAVVLQRPWGWLLLGAAVCVSRAACALVCHQSVPIGRSEGLGAAVAATVSNGAFLMVHVCSALLLIAVATLACVPCWLSLTAVLAAPTAVVLLLRNAIRTFGGVTGDVMGAAIELSFAVQLVVLAAGWSTC